MDSQTFRTTLEATGGNNVAIVVPYPNTISSMGGRFLLSFNAATRERRVAKALEALRG